MSDIIPADMGDDIPFTPVPRASNRRDGWHAGRQREFIRQLRRIGCASAAARAVGMSPRTAYRLREHPEGASFAAAWDQAVDEGRETLHFHAIDRCLHGELVPVFYRGRQVGTRRLYNDRLAIAALSGRGRDIVEQRVERERARAYRETVRREAERQAAAEAERRLAEMRPAARPQPQPEPLPRAEPRIILF